jgi:hypothetical protein
MTRALCYAFNSFLYVYLQGKILEKPQDEKDAFNMLSSLSGIPFLAYFFVN